MEALRCGGGHRFSLCSAACADSLRQSCNSVVDKIDDAWRKKEGRRLESRSRGQIRRMAFSKESLGKLTRAAKEQVLRMDEAVTGSYLMCPEADHELSLLAPFCSHRLWHLENKGSPTLETNDACDSQDPVTSVSSSMTVLSLPPEFPAWQADGDDLSSVPPTPTVRPEALVGEECLELLRRSDDEPLSPQRSTPKRKNGKAKKERVFVPLDSNFLMNVERAALRSLVVTDFGDAETQTPRTPLLGARMPSLQLEVGRKTVPPLPGARPPPLQHLEARVPPATRASSRPPPLQSPPPSGAMPLARPPPPLDPPQQPLPAELVPCPPPPAPPPPMPPVQAPAPAQASVIPATALVVDPLKRHKVPAPPPPVALQPEPVRESAKACLPDASHINCDALKPGDFVCFRHWADSDPSCLRLLLRGERVRVTWTDGRPLGWAHGAALSDPAVEGYFPQYILVGSSQLVRRDIVRGTRLRALADFQQPKEQGGYLTVHIGDVVEPMHNSEEPHVWVYATRADQASSGWVPSCIFEPAGEQVN